MAQVVAISICILLAVETNTLVAQAVEVSSPIANTTELVEIDRTIDELLVKAEKSYNKLQRPWGTKHEYALQAVTILTLLDCEKSEIETDNLWSDQVFQSFVESHLSLNPNISFKQIATNANSHDRSHFQGAFVLWASVELSRGRQLNVGEIIKSQAAILYESKMTTEHNRNKKFTGWGYAGHVHGDGTAVVARALTEAAVLDPNVKLKADESIKYLEQFTFDNSNNKYRPGAYYSDVTLAEGDSRPVVRALIYNTLDRHGGCLPEDKTRVKKHFERIAEVIEAQSEKYFEEGKGKDSTTPLGYRDDHPYAPMLAYEYTDFLRRNELAERCTERLLQGVKDVKIKNESPYELFLMCSKIRALCNIKRLLMPSPRAFRKDNEVKIEIPLNFVSKDDFQVVERISLKAGSFLRVDIPASEFKINDDDTRLEAHVVLAGILWDDFLNHNTDVQLEYLKLRNGQPHVFRRHINVVK